MSPVPLITVARLAYRSGKCTILHDIDFTLSEGELLTIVGPNGAGKSTLLKLLLGHLAPTSGEIWRRPQLAMAYVPQQFKVPPDLPITMRRFLRDIADADKARVLAALGIAESLDRPLQNLSGGETQRLLLARAMLLDPDLIALDEPAAGIDPASLGSYYQTIRDHQLQRGCTIVLVSHDLHLVMAASDRVLCVNRHICCSGLPKDVMADPVFAGLTGSHRDTIGFYNHHHGHAHR